MAESVIEWERVTLSEGVVLHLWIPLFHLGRDMTLSEGKQVLRDYRKMETYIQDNPEIVGWITWVYEQFPNVHNIIYRVGGKIYGKDKNMIWFIKYREDS